MPRVPRLPLVPDPLRRIRVPRDLDAVTAVGEEADPADAGLSRDRVEQIWRDAVTWYRSGVHPAMQVCVRRHGLVVLDRAIGHARGNGPGDPPDAGKVPVATDTPFCVYSASKAVTAFVVHGLIEQGKVGLDEPVADYIPGYGINRKHAVTVGHVLAHRAGVPNMPAHAFDLDRMGDREFITGTLVDAEPFARPGRMLAYHAVSGGFILGEIVHQVTGHDIRTELAERILDPLGFRWTNYGVDEADLDALGTDYVTGPPLLPPASLLLTRALGVSLDTIVEWSGDQRFRTAVIPAANIMTTANELSRFFEVMRRGGELDGVRVLEPETIATALTEQSHLEMDLSLGFPTRFSYGLMLGAQLVSLFGRDTQRAFGHLGFTNTLGWADPQRGTSVGIVTSGKPTIYPEVWRFLGLSQRITGETTP
ncbi:MAG TPA: serine hydrolase domain-containing protein [Thermoleophilaceae bacterium]|nr:serine hydrolase domain-containing protein [Thermoleophilaceae bacterium]